MPQLSVTGSPSSRGLASAGSSGSVMAGGDSSRSNVGFDAGPNGSRDAAESVLGHTGRRWNLAGPLPVPRGDWLACPVCRTPHPVIRFWRFHRRPEGATIPYRCDVSFKCRSCAAVWPHGIAIDADSWDRRIQHPTRLGQWFNRRSNVEWTLWARDLRKWGLLR